MPDNPRTMTLTKEEWEDLADRLIEAGDVVGAILRQMNGDEKGEQDEKDWKMDVFLAVTAIMLPILRQISVYLSGCKEYKGAMKMPEQKPLCRYCGPWNGHPDGVEMDMHQAEYPSNRTTTWWSCSVCHSRTPAVITARRRDGKKKSIEAALRSFKPMQKPLTLDEIKNLPNPFEPDVPPFLWVETRKCLDLRGSHWFSFSDMIEICKLEKNGIQYSYSHPLRAYRYGVDFRAWWKRPTDEERAAAKWEEETR